MSSSSSSQRPRTSTAGGRADAYEPVLGGSGSEYPTRPTTSRAEEGTLPAPCLPSRNWCHAVPCRHQLAWTSFRTVTPLQTLRCVHACDQGHLRVRVRVHSFPMLGGRPKTPGRRGEEAPPPGRAKTPRRGDGGAGAGGGAGGGAGAGAGGRATPAAAPLRWVPLFSVIVCLWVHFLRT